jgi:hypothetical protein
MDQSRSPGLQPGDPISIATRYGEHKPAIRRCASSQQVEWYECVYLFVKPWLDAVGDWPTVGTAAWTALEDGDPRKWAALLDAAQHWALRVETCQQAECHASRAVSAARNWKAVTAKITARTTAIADGAYIPRRSA